MVVWLCKGGQGKGARGDAGVGAAGAIARAGALVLQRDVKGVGERRGEQWCRQGDHVSCTEVQLFAPWPLHVHTLNELQAVRAAGASDGVVQCGEFRTRGKWTFRSQRVYGMRRERAIRWGVQYAGMQAGYLSKGKKIFSFYTVDPLTLVHLQPLLPAHYLLFRPC